MSLNLIDIILDAAMGAIDYQYDRITEEVDDYGRAVNHTETFTGRGNFQPAPGEEMDRLPEGDQGREAFMVFTPAALVAGPGIPSATQTKADRVHYNGKRYRVSLAEPWREHAGFTKAIIVYEGGDD